MQFFVNFAPDFFAAINIDWTRLFAFVRMHCVIEKKSGRRNEVGQGGGWVPEKKSGRKKERKKRDIGKKERTNERKKDIKKAKRERKLKSN